LYQVTELLSRDANVIGTKENLSLSLSLGQSPVQSQLKTFFRIRWQFLVK